MKETQITAYALNELQGDERDTFESDLASDQDLQHALESASRVADGLAVVMSEPGEGLEPQARAKLLRAIAENQEAFRQRRKIVRFAVPVSLAAAASIAVLLWVTGGTTTQGPAVAAADGPGAVSEERSVGLTAKINSDGTSFAFRGDGRFSSPQGKDIEDGAADSFQVNGIRVIGMSESARMAQESRQDAGLSLTSPAVRMKPLIWDEDLTRLGGVVEQP